MDPMDFTMDDGHQLHSNAPRCQYQHTQQTSSSSNFPHPSQNAHHYDPVHNTESWYSQNRPQFPAPQNISQWGPATHMPISSWNGFPEAHGGMLNADSAFRSQNAFSGMPNNTSPWADVRGFDPLPFGYGQTYTHPQPSNTASLDTGSTRGGVSSGAAASDMPQAASSARRFDIGRRTRNSINIPDPLTAQTADLARAMRATREDVRAAQQVQAQVSRSFDYIHSHPQQDSPPRRRPLAHTWDSDDDDDSSPDMDHETLRREALYAEFDEEQRALASMRGALAAGKKVPSKEAIASIEKLEIKDLGESDKSCIICYNDFGVENPEGLIEQPIRLPKCKHIFGDKCIKKWFEDSDTCPYCRDKLPSERVVTKSFTYEAMHARHRERTAALSAAQAAAQHHRSRQTLNARLPSSDELTQESLSRSYSRTQEEYHYLMRAHQPQDSWGYSPPNNRSSHRDVTFTQRDSPERRRQQVRGRAALGRPTSVGSSRYYMPPSTYQNALQRGNLPGLSASTNNHGTNSMPHRPVTPPPQNSDRTSDSATSTPSSQNRTSVGSSSSEEASPAVAVGSGMTSGDRSSSSSQPRFGAFNDHAWLEHPSFGDPMNSNLGNSSFAPGRANDFPRAISFESGANVSSPINQHIAGFPY